MGSSRVWHTSFLLTSHWLEISHMATPNYQGHWWRMQSCMPGNKEMGVLGRSPVHFWIPNLCFLLIFRALIPSGREKMQTPDSNCTIFSIRFICVSSILHDLVTYEQKSQGICLTFPSQPSIHGGAWAENCNKKSY